jgi:hypothetical protein
MHQVDFVAVGRIGGALAAQRLAIEKPEAIVVKEDIGIGVVIAGRFWSGHKGIAKAVRDEPVHSVIADKELGIFGGTVRVGIGSASHPIGPAAWAEALGDIKDVGVSGLAGAVGGLQIQEHGPVESIAGRADAAVGSIAMDWGESAEAQAEACGDAVQDKLGRQVKIKQDGNKQERKDKDSG